MTLEFLRRVGREYDAFIVRRAQLRTSLSSPPAEQIANGGNTSGSDTGKPGTITTVPVPIQCAPHGVRPTPIEQLVRAALHMLQFAVAYFVMLLAMYFNGYIIICIFIGAFLGSVVFSWEEVGGVTSK
ncbi:hypothetical protein EYZ11_008546 [Aspergillus tanneri]|nr:hypothetical protein EYZ11_008546 [Aspergillus tanneri]